ncbi:MAG: prepilin peptidase [Alphaproteobacteria bacterium]|nr:prepilin peptidase [Alphaproteobacteria bacterium]
MSTLALFVFPFAMALAASSDLLTMTISNKLVLALVAGFFVIAVAIGMPLADMGLHVLGALAVLVVGFIFFAQGWIGGGDAKLAAATTLWLGLTLTIPYLVYAAFGGGMLTLMILALRRMPLTPLIARFHWLERLHDRNTGVPYGIALAMSGLLTYSSTAIFERLTA